jgi:hypothetical protein
MSLCRLEPKPRILLEEAGALLPANYVLQTAFDA